MVYTMERGEVGQHQWKIEKKNLLKMRGNYCVFSNWKNVE